AIFALDMKKQGKLKNNGLVVTVMSNLGLFHFAKEYGIDTPTTKVGDRYVLETIIKDGYNLGGEQSGHVIFFDDMTTGDGQLSAVKLLNVIVREQKPLHVLRKIMTKYPQVLKNVKADDELKASLWELDDLFKEMNDKLGERGRVLVRPSGTEPLVRVMVEGADFDEINEICDTIAKAIEAKQN
ncbi:MAG: phosphoglucosamine mutase, partial [Oscillospiraceae bacterium]|nr:phosphoglucosamine mutase [Oscillospiraceae bacterium]